MAKHKKQKNPKKSWKKMSWKQKAALIAIAPFVAISAGKH